MTKVAVVLLAGLLLSGCLNKGKPQDLGLSGTGEGISIEDRVSEFGKQFGVTIPEDVDKIVLESTTGEPASGLATRDRKQPATVTILANLPDLTGKEKYSVYLVDNNQKIFLGDLSVAKAGWMLEKTVSADPLAYRTVEVLRGEKVVLRGEFK